MADRAIVVNGYAYPDINQELLVQTAPDLTFLSAFTYGATEEGELIQLADQEMVETARPFGVKSLMVLSAVTDDRGVVGKIYNDPEALIRFVDEILDNLRTKGMFGVDFDFEFIPPEDRDAYTGLIQFVRERLNWEGFIVTAALAPKTSDDQQGLLYEGHDYEGIGRAANLSLLMTYEWGYTYGPPMAVAPLNKVREVLDYGVTKIAPSRILMGIPNYGYDWTLPFVQGESRARSIGNEEAVWLAEYYGAVVQFDETAQSPFFFYWDATGRQHEVWFEDARSIRAKLSLVEEYSLAGVSYWNLMRPFRANWEVLREMYDPIKL